MKIRLFSGKLLISLIAFLLFASSELPSSSKAEDGFWLTRSQSGLEQLWSGVLGCTESTDSFAIRNRFNDSEDTNSGAPSTGASIDYSECGKRALRNTSSRILVDTIEGAIRSGGVALFSEHFRLDSSVGWVFGEDVTGEIDAVIPLFSRERSNGTGQALFLQPGAVFWSGLESEDRIDANLGLAYRQHLAPDIVAGGSIFYDYDFKREHQRIGIGADLQRGAFHAALNYYHPLNEWQEGRTEYEEQPLQGADFRLGLAWSRVRLDAGVGVWRFEGEEEESTKWRPSFEFGAGYLIYPGVFLQGGYERHDSDDSLDSRWNAELAFRFSLPGLQGVKSYETMAQANLWEPVEREKRILYEEREAVPPVRLSAPTGADGAELTSLPEEGDTITIVGNLEALSVPVMLELVIDEEASSADLGDDFRYGHKVYELDAATGQQSAPSDATICPASRCEMMIPARVTRFDVEIEILSDSVAREIPEEIVLEVEVPEEYQRMVRGGARTVGIQAHGNTVQFTEAMSTLDENGGMVDVAVNANLASPSPITLNVTATSTDAVQGRDYTFPSGSLTIPSNADGEITSASVRLTGINNDRGEGSKTITLTIPDDQSLPTGWTFGTQTTHTVTLQDDDLAIFFTEATRDRVEEPASDQSVTVTVGITQAPTVDIAVVVAAGGTGETASSSDDYTFSSTELTFRSGMTTPQTATLTLLADTGTEAEPDEFIVLTLTDKDNDATARNTDGFSLDGPHTITIVANDNTVGFASNAVATLRERENNETVGVDVSISHAAPEDITLNVSVNTTTSTATEGTDFTLSPSTLTIPRGQTSGTIMLTSINNDDGEGSKDIVLTLSVSGSLPTGWTLGTATHTVTLQDDDLNISFVTSGTGAIPSSAEEGTPVDITVGITQAPTAEIKVMVAVDTSASTVQTNDYTLTGAELTFSTSSAAAQTAALMVLQDSVAEAENETIVLTLSEVSGLTTGGNNFSLGGSHTITIPKNGNTVGFASGTSTLTEGANTMREVTVNVDEPAPADIELVVEVLTASTATEGMNGDYTIDSKSLTIDAGESSGTITVRSVNDNVGEGDKTIMLEIKLAGGSSLPDGWTLGTAMHTVTLKDDDRSIHFVTGAGNTPSEVEEPARPGNAHTSKTVTIAVGITHAPTADIMVKVEAGGMGETADSSASLFTEDYVFGGATLTFPRGSTATQTTSLTLVNANVRDPEEYIVLTLSEVGNSLTNEGTNFSLGADHTITIPGNGNFVSFGSRNSTLVEGAGTPIMVPVNVEAPAPVPITLNVEVLTTGTATEGMDYENLPDSLTIGAGEMTGMITLREMNDNIEEGNETIELRIGLPQGVSSLPDGWDFGTVTTHTVTLQDDDLEIYFVTGAGNTPSEAAEPASGSTTPVAITVGIDRAPVANIRVMVEANTSASCATLTSCATLNDDYTFTSTPLTFGMGSTTSQTTSLTVLDDAYAEGDEYIVLTLTAVGTDLADEGQNFMIVDSHTITIPANDRAVRFASDASTFVEGVGTTRTVTVEAVPPAPVPITLDVEILTTGTATRNTDYTIGSESLTIGANQPSGTITLTSINDNNIEGNETIMLRIKASSSSPLPSGWTVTGQTTHDVTLHDDDLNIRFITGAGNTPSEVAEPASGSTPVTIAVGIARAPDAEIKVTVAADTMASSADSGTDYTFSATELTFPAGSTAAQTATLMVLDDADPENDQTIVLTLADPDGTLAAEGNDFSLGGPHTITIPANDRTVRFASSASTLSEDAGTPGEVTVEVIPPAPGGVTLDVEVTGSATKNTDFMINSESLTIGANQSSGTITITAMNDTLPEGPETITLEIKEPSGSSLPTGWTFGTATHTVTLQDNESEIFFVTDTTKTPHTQSEVVEPASGSTSVTLVVGITRPSTTPITVKLATAGLNNKGQTAERGAGKDYTLGTNGEVDLTFPANSTAPQTATLMVLDDADPEGDQTIVLTLTDSGGSLTGSGFSLGDDHIITIPSNDRAVRFVSSASTLSEGATMPMEVTVEVVPPAPTAFTLDVDVVDTGSKPATRGANEDYTIDSDTLMIGANQSSGTIIIRSREDTLPEGPETITLEISEADGSSLPTGWSFGTQTRHTVTLQDNESEIYFVTGDNKTPSEVEEPDIGTLPVMVTVGITRAPASGDNITVTVAPAGLGNSGQTAEGGNGKDYTFTAMNNIMFTADGPLEQTLPLTILSDNVPAESDETIVLTLADMGSSLTNTGFMLGANHTITIPANKTNFEIGFAEPSSTHNEGDGTVRPRVSIRPGSSEAITFGVRVVTGPGGSTTGAGDDYTNDFPRELTINARPTAAISSLFVNVSLIDDSIDEVTETIILEIFEPTAGFPSDSVVFGENRRHVLSIIDNDIPAMTLGFHAGRSNANVDEGGVATIILEIANGLPSAAQISVAIDVDGVSNPSGYTLSDPNAGFAGGSFDGATNVVTIDAMTTSFTLLLQIPEDNANTTDETITLTLAEGSTFPTGGWTLGSTNSPTTWTIGVDDND